MTKELLRIANEADVIVNGYAFTRRENQVAVLNLHRRDSAAVLSMSGEMLETSMDDIELSLVQEYFHRNMKYLEASYVQVL